MAPRNRSSLSSALDREVYQVVRKFIDDQTQYTGEAPKLNYASVYDQIRRSNSSLNRRPKKLLEDSIQRVLESIQTPEDDEDEHDFNAAIEKEEEQLKVKQGSSNGLNKSIVGAWGTSTPIASRAGTATPTAKRERNTNGESVPKRRKTASSNAIDRAPPTNISFLDLGGIDEIVGELFDLLALPLTRPEIMGSLDVQGGRGILLHGPPGCGKTTLVNALAAELEVSFISISAPSIVSGMSGESEKALRDHFEEAKKCAPCLMFIDEIDAVAPKRESAQREMEKRIVAQLATCLDDLSMPDAADKPVFVLAATNRPDSIDPSLRRSGRLGKEILMPVPNEKVREEILKSLTRKLPLADDINFTVLAQRTPGCVGGDLKDLVQTTANTARKRITSAFEAKLEQESQTTEMDLDTPATQPIPPNIARWRRLQTYNRTHPDPVTTIDVPLQSTTDTLPLPPATPAPTTAITTLPTVLITHSDFLSALPQIQPSALREGFATIPTTTFADIGALGPHRTTLYDSIIRPILHPTLHSKFHLRLSTGILLWGPPGCGKTLLAKAVANSSHANFISIKGPELLNKYVGESERAVRTLFTRARSSVPVIIFFDELDALVPRRDGSSSEASARVVNTLLSELDGVGASNEGIYVVGATNRPDMIDPAMTRPGRFEIPLYVGLPGEEERVDILRTLVRGVPTVEWGTELEALARGCERFSGADLRSLVGGATRVAIRRCLPAGSFVEGGVSEVETEIVGDGDVRITLGDFVEARKAVFPSNSAEEIARMLALRKVLEG